jgi:hypothetical protein
MSASTVQIVYEMHTTEFDIELRDTRRRGYRTANGRMRPYFSFVFSLKASLVVAFSLSAIQPHQRTLTALLYAAMTESADRPYGGLPDEIWLYESTASFAPRLQHLRDNLGITIRSITKGEHPTGEAERFLEMLKQQIWETLPANVGVQGIKQEDVREYLTLHELEDVLKKCLIDYHQRTNSETGQFPLTFWQTHCSPCPADPLRLASLLGGGINSTINRRGIYYQNR